MCDSIDEHLSEDGPDNYYSVDDGDTDTMVEIYSIDYINWHLYQKRTSRWSL